jgi:hypothetical protein
MGFWDRATHMSKREWRDACQRTLNRLANLKAEVEGQQPKPAEGQKSQAGR